MEVVGKDVVFDVSVAPEGQGADYASNVAFVLAKKLKKSPRDIAEELRSRLSRKRLPKFTVDVAGNGFLNFTVFDSALLDGLGRFEVKGASKKYAKKRVVTEFSDPNPFKVLHVGHLYTSVVGDAISRMIEYAGGKVHRVNFGGDVGLHVAKTMWAMDYSDIDSKKTLDSRMEYIAECYVKGTVAYEEDEAAKSEIVALNKKIYAVATKGEKKTELGKMYWKCRAWSYEYFEKFYDHIGMKFEKYYPESTVAELGVKTVRKNTPKVYEESEGAVVFKGEKYGLHTRVFINREGLPTYETKDVGLIEQKWKDYKFDESVVITGADITEYMKVVLKSVEQFDPKLVERTRHIVHGNVVLPGAMKMSSRKGNFLKAMEVLDMVAEEERNAFGKEADWATVNGRLSSCIAESCCVLQAQVPAPHKWYRVSRPEQPP